MKRKGIITTLAMLLMALSASVAVAATVIDDANAPSGTHLQAGTIGCTVGTDGLTVTCTPYELGGVGNTNADVLLTATYSGVIDCRNKGGNIVESHETTFSDASGGTVRSSKNGRLRVGAQEVSPDLALGEPCPNPNWTPSFHPGSLTLDSWSYTLTFAGFGEPYISITP
jgi:hypothetical protein